MSVDLLSLLSLGANAIDAQNAGVAVATNNVANANTPGYSREVVQLASVDSSSPLVGGVVAGATTRTADSLLAAQVLSSAGNLASSTAQSTGLGALETTLSANPISDTLASMFAAFDQVAAAPTDTTTRDAAVAALQATATSINDAATAASTAQGDANDQVTSLASQANALAGQLAAANVAARGGSPTALDQRDQLATQLAQLVGGQASVGSDGQMRFVLAGGAVLVDGSTANTMSTVADPTTGLADVVVSGGGSQRDVTTELAGGQLAGAIAVRGQATAVGTQYDQLAFDLATTMNATATANAAPDGTTGHALFVEPTQVAGAAAALAVDPALAASSNVLATASPGGGAGDGSGALALFDLSSATLADGGTQTATDAALDIQAGLGQQVATATSTMQTDQTVDTNLGTLQASISGVDVNEEQANLSQYEDSVSALTQFVSSINTMMTNLVENI